MIVVEVMGRNSGWIAFYSGIAGGADVILIPERPFDIQEVADTLKRRHDRGKYFSIVVVAEGAKLAERKIISDEGKTDDSATCAGWRLATSLAAEIESRTGFETRSVVLGTYAAWRNAHGV